jgi:hypothetical protein
VCKVYAYVPRVNDICNDSEVLCNDGYGISLSRGSFDFASGQYASYIFLFVAPVDARSKVEPRYHAGPVKQPTQRSQWTGDSLVSASSQTIFRNLLMLMVQFQ